MNSLPQNSKKEASITQQRQEKLKAIRKHTPSAEKRFRDAYARKSRKSAIEAHCIECMGFEDYQEGIKHCTSPLCPLWEYRPYRNKQRSI